MFVQIALKSLDALSKVPALGSYSNVPSPPASATPEVTTVVPKYPFPKLNSPVVAPPPSSSPKIILYHAFLVSVNALIVIPVPEFCTVPFFPKYNFKLSKSI